MRRYSLQALFITLTLFLSFTVVAQEAETVNTSLNILSVTPAPDAMNVNPSDGQIVVMFDRSVVPITELSRPQPLLQFEPPIRGIGEWVHPAIYRFTPEPRALVGGTIYMVTLPDSLTAIDGAVLNETFGWSFRTVDPQVIEIKPTRIWTDKWTTLRDSAFVVTFTQPMDRTSTQAAFTVERYVGSYCYDGCSERPNDWIAIEGYFSWNVENTEMTFTPAELLNYSVPDIGSYRASLTTDALNSAGSAALTQPVSDYFATVTQPYITGISPSIEDGIEPGLQTIEVTFSGPMNTETYRGRYNISPVPAGEIFPTIGPDGTTLRLTFEHALHETYTVTLLPGIEDRYGTPIEKEYSSTYFVRNPRPENMRYVFASPEGQPLAIIGDYLEDPSIPLSVFGEGDLEVVLDVYQTNLDQLLSDAAQAGRNFTNAFSYDSTYSYASTGYGYATTYPDIEWVRPEQLVSHRVENFNVVRTDRFETVQMALQDPDSPPLPLGLYGVQLDKKSSHVIAVTNVSLTLKRSADELIVWVTDYNIQPLANVRLKVQGAQYTAVETTDSEGFARFPLNAQEGSVFVSTLSDDLFGIWFSNEVPFTPKAAMYLYTDRAIYRPGEPVHYRGILRHRNDMTYTVPDTTELRVYATVDGNACYYDYYCSPKPIYQVELPLTSFGTFSGTIQLPDDLAPNRYQILFSTCPPDAESCTSLAHANTSFHVAEVRVPDFTVQVTPQYNEILSGDPMNMDVFATYYFGGAVGTGSFTRYGLSTTLPFAYRGSDVGYTFGDYNYTGRVEIYRPDERLAIQPDGHYLLTDTAELQSSLPVLLNVEATMIDDSGQSVSGRGSVTVHPSTAYIGLRPQNTAVPFGQPIVVDALTVTHESVIRPEQDVFVEVVEERVIREEVSFGYYNWKRVEIPTSYSRLTTDSAGHAVYEYLPQKAGRFRVTMFTYDEQGRRGQSSVWVVIEDDAVDPIKLGYAFTTSSCDSREITQYLSVITDRTNQSTNYDQTPYKVGETARIFFQNPYGMPVIALISVQRGLTGQTEIVRVDEEMYAYDIPLTSLDYPYTSVHVTLMRPPMIEHEYPAHITGSTYIRVDDPARRLNIEITPSTDVAGSGEQVSFDMLVTDHMGRPVSAEIGMSLTDDAVTALAYRYLSTLEEHFYTQTRRTDVSITASSRALLKSAHFDLGSYCGMGGGGGLGDAPLRDDFIYTPLWEPHVVTDDNGRASVSVTMPDNTTQWTLEAQALTMDMKVGEGKASLVTRLPLIVRAIAPRFLVAGDHLPLAAIVHNNTDEPIRVTVTLDAQGVTLDNGNPTQIILLPPFGLQRVEWWVKVEAVEGVHMAVSAVSDNRLQDASIPTLTTGENNTIPVYAFTVTETLATSGILTETGEVTERIDLRQMTTVQDVSLTVAMQAQLSSTMLERIQVLKLSSEPSIFELADYIRIAVAGLNAVDDLPDDERNLLLNHIQSSVERLGQLRNVGWAWGWYESMGNDPYATARVLNALADAKTIGITLNSSAFEDAVRYLSSFVRVLGVNTPSDELNNQAQIMYTLSQYDAITLDSLNALYEYRLEMSIAARALLLSAFLEIAPDAEAVKSLISDLNGSAIISATGTHWEESDEFRRYGMEGARTTALVLAALLKAEPDYWLAPSTIRWLMTARSERSLWIGEETAWLTVALGEWTRAIDESQPAYSFSVTLNDDQVSEGAFMPDEVDTQIYRTSFSMDDFALDQPNDVTIQRSEGSGALYYTARLHTTYPADAAEEIARGVRIEREYVRDTDGAPLDTVTAGDLVIVRLTLYVSQDFQYFRLQDILPAGLEPIDPSLLINTQQSQPPLLKSLNRQNPYWNWGYQYWGRTKIYDDGIVLQARYLPRGVYSYAYQARAISPGEFSIPPAVGMAELQPEVFGRTEAGYLIIQPQ
jgi:uncharacterized protein YfaS (alpha-2-macroglobulin family)